MGVLTELEKIFFIAVTIFLLYEKTSGSVQSATDFSLGKYVLSQGYPYENHTVLTEDGYYLTLARLPYEKRQECPERRSVALLLHGNFGNAELFVLGRKDSALAFLLWEKCHDVWLTNNRGTKFSLRHTKWSYTDREFWDSSFDDVVNYDLRSVLHYLSKVTNGSLINAIGYSSGAAILVGLLSSEKKLQKQFKSLQFMAPAVFLEHKTNHLLMPLPVIYTALKETPELFARDIFGSSYENFHQFLAIFAKKTKSEQNFIRSLVVQNLEETDSEIPNEILSTLFPDRLSLKFVAQLAQFHCSGNFSMYDYGSRNMEIYGQDYPPHYPVESLHVPTYLYHSSGDTQVAPPDVERLARTLPNVKKKLLINDPTFDHYYFNSGSLKAKQLVLSPILETLDSL